MSNLTRRGVVTTGLGTAAGVIAASASSKRAHADDGHGGHTGSFGEVRFDGTTPTITNDSGDFTVTYNATQETFMLEFKRDISKTVVSLTPFFEYVGDQPYLSIHAARQDDPRQLGVAISRADRPFSKPGCGFWVKVMYLKNCPE